MLLEDEMEAVVPGLRYVDQRGDEVFKAVAGAASAKVGSVMSPQARAQMAHPLSSPGRSARVRGTPRRSAPFEPRSASKSGSTSNTKGHSG
jgi:predicted DNA-binding transcriptional regulator YafY